MKNGTSKLRIQRKYGESIMIGHHIKITLLKPESRGMVSILFEAPRNIPIHREEWYDAHNLGVKTLD